MIALPALEAIDIERDLRGRPDLLTFGTGVEARPYAFVWDTQGFLEGFTDPLARTTSFERDPVGRVIAEARPDTEVTEFAYDANGSRIGVTPPSQPEHSFSDDGTMRLSSNDAITLDVRLTDPDFAGPFAVSVIVGTVGGASSTVLELELGAGAWQRIDVPLPNAGDHWVVVQVHEREPDRMAWSAPVFVRRT